MNAVFGEDPQGGMKTFATMLRRVVTMPGRLMFDGKDPDLFDHFAIVAQRLGVYTVADYAAIVRHLVETWNVAAIPVSGEAAREQEFLCRQPERIESMLESVGDRLALEPPVTFSWIHGRSA